MSGYEKMIEGKKEQHADGHGNRLTNWLSQHRPSWSCWDQRRCDQPLQSSGVDAALVRQFRRQGLDDLCRCVCWYESLKREMSEMSEVVRGSRNKQRGLGLQELGRVEIGMVRAFCQLQCTY